MSDYIIFGDSTSDISQKYVDDAEAIVLPMTFTIKDKEYLHYLDCKNMSLEEFYKIQGEGNNAKTSQLNEIFIEDNVRPYLEKGLDILFVAFSSGLSGTYNSIRLAFENLKEEYPDRKLLVIDSLCASSGEGLLLLEAFKNKQKGMTIEENYNTLENLKLRIRHWFTVDELNTLKRGGRITATAATAAKILNIKPVLRVDDLGHLVSVCKKIGHKTAIKDIVQRTIEDLDQNYPTIISNTNCPDDAKLAYDLLKKYYEENNIKSEIILERIGPVIGAHSGPTTLAIFTVGKNR